MMTGKLRVYLKLFLLSAVFIVGVTGVLTASAHTIDGWIKTNQATPMVVKGATIVFLDGAGNVVGQTVSQGDPTKGYFIIDLDSGTYEVLVIPPALSDRLSGLNIENFVVTQTETVGDWYLNYFLTEVYLSGTVYEATGVLGLPGCKVFLFDGDFFYPDDTDANGEYIIKCPAEGAYEFKVKATAGHNKYNYDGLQVTDGGTKDIVLTHPALSTGITGTITDSVYGTPYEDVLVKYSPDPAEDPKYGPYTAMTDENGDYSLYAPPGITFDIAITPPSYSAAEEQTEADYLVPAPPVPHVKDYALENQFPVSVFVDDGSTIDEVYLADHTSDLDDGNYITLSTGDISVDLPDPMEVDYSGPREAENEYEGNVVTVYSAFETKNVISPINAWELYFAPATVTVTYHGDPRLEGDTIDVRLLTATYGDVIDAVSEARDGNAQPLKDLLADAMQTETRTLNADGDFDALPQFTVNDPGDYTVVIVTETTSPYVLHLYSAAPVEVLDYHIDVIPDYDPAAPEFGVDVEIDFVDSPTGTEFSYASLLIRDDAYSLYSDVNSDGTVDGTTVDVQHQGDDPKPLYRIASNGEILGIPYANYQDLLDYDLLNNELGNVYNLDEYSLGSNLETSETVDVIIGLDTDGFQGQYVLTTVVWEHDTGNRIVAFDQQQISIGAPTFDSLTSNLPKSYGDVVDVPFQIQSPQEYIGASYLFEVTIDGNPIASSTTTVPTDISVGVNQFTYQWDTLSDVPTTYKTGGSVVITITIQDDSQNPLVSQTTSGTLNYASRDSIFTGRLVPLTIAWSGYTEQEKNDVFSNTLVPITILWSSIPDS